MMRLLPTGFFLYRLLLLLYPGEFRRNYAEEMHLLFREMCLQEWHRRGWAGLLSFWWEALFDLLWSVFLLHRERAAVAALASASATLTYGIALLMIEPGLSYVAGHPPQAPAAFGLAVPGMLQTFVVGWMCVLCGLLFFPRTNRATVVVLSLAEPLEAFTGSNTRDHLDA